MTTIEVLVQEKLGQGGGKQAIQIQKMMIKVLDRERVQGEDASQVAPTGTTTIEAWDQGSPQVGGGGDINNLKSQRNVRKLPNQNRRTSTVSLHLFHRWGRDQIALKVW